MREEDNVILASYCNNFGRLKKYQNGKGLGLDHFQEKKII